MLLLCLGKYKRWIWLTIDLHLEEKKWLWLKWLEIKLSSKFSDIPSIIQGTHTVNYLLTYYLLIKSQSYSHRSGNESRHPRTTFVENISSRWDIVLKIYFWRLDMLRIILWTRDISGCLECDKSEDEDTCLSIVSVLALPLRWAQLGILYSYFGFKL